MAIPCTSCHATLDRHCSSPTCHWLACLSTACTVRFYDTDRGVRSLRNGTVETLGRPPIAPEMDGA